MSIFGAPAPDSENTWITEEIVTLANTSPERSQVFWDSLRAEVIRQIRLNQAREKFRLSQDMTRILVDRVFKRQTEAQPETAQTVINRLNELHDKVYAAGQYTNDDAIAFVKDYELLITLEVQWLTGNRFDELYTHMKAYIEQS